jgi:hypothetical protein
MFRLLGGKKNEVHTTWNKRWQGSSVTVKPGSQGEAARHKNRCLNQEITLYEKCIRF